MPGQIYDPFSSAQTRRFAEPDQRGDPLTPGARAIVNREASAARRDPLDDQIRTINERRTNLHYQREGLKTRMQEFLSNDGADLFETDTLSGKPLEEVDPDTGQKRYVPKLGAEVEALRAKSQEKTGLIAGALSPSKQRGDPTNDALAAQQRLAEIEPVYRLKQEKFQRINDELNRVDQFDKNFEAQLGELGRQREARFTVNADNIAAAVDDVNADRQMRGQPLVTPKDLSAAPYATGGTYGMPGQYQPDTAGLAGARLLVDPQSGQAVGRAIAPQAVDSGSIEMAQSTGLPASAARTLALARAIDEGATHVGDQPVDGLVTPEAINEAKLAATVGRIRKEIAKIDSILGGGKGLTEPKKQQLEKQREVYAKVLEQKISTPEYAALGTINPELKPPANDDSWDITRGVKVALGQTMPLLKGVVGLFGHTAEKVIGSNGVVKAVKDWGLKGYQEGMTRLQPLQKENDDLSTSWKRAKEGDWGALVDWAQYGLGYTVGQMGETAAMALIGGLAGSAAEPGLGTLVGAAGGAVAKNTVRSVAKGLVEKWIAKEAAKLVEAGAAKAGVKLTAEQVAEQVAKEEVRKLATKSLAKTVGASAAIGANAFTQELGSIYPEAVAKAAGEGRELSGTDLARVWGTGIAAGGVEFLTDKLGLDVALGKVRVPLGKTAVGRAAVGALGGAVVEGGTEVAQTALERVGAGQSLVDEEALNDYLNSGALGALGGGLVGGGGGALHGTPSEGGEGGTTKPAQPPANPVTKGGGRNGAQEGQGPQVLSPATPPTANNPASVATPPAAPTNEQGEPSLDQQAEKTFEVTNQGGQTVTVTAVRESQVPQKLPEDFGPIAGLKRVESPTAAVEGEKINREWTQFSTESGTLGIPRADMPQVKAEHRGALTQFLKGRDIASEEAEVKPSELKPTQAEFSPAKVAKAREFTGGDRAILVSSDNYVVDGHHQWMAKLTDAPDQPMRVIRLNAPIRDVLAQVKEFPSASTAAGATGQISASQPTASQATATIAPGGAAVRGENAIGDKGGVPPAPVAPEPTAAKPTAPAPAIARGMNKPATFVQAVAKASGLKAKDTATRFLQDFAPRLHRANAKEFANMEVHVLNQQEWNAHKDVGVRTPDSAAAYNPETNTLYFNSEKMRDPETAVSAVVHEMGHFAEKFALGEDFTQREWEKLGVGAMRSAVREYNNGSLTPDETAKDFTSDRRARSEWVAMQFARVVRGETEGMSQPMVSKLKKLLQMARELVTKWVGSKSLTTKELDAKILGMLGYTAREGTNSAAAATPGAKPGSGILPAANPTAAAAQPAISDELKKLGDDLFGTPGTGAGYSQKFDPAQIEAANKFVALLVREHPQVRSRAALARFITENFPKARPYSEAVFRIMGGFVDLDESGTFADAYGAIDNPAPKADTIAPNERAASDRGNLDAGERNAGTVEQRPAERETGGASPENGLPAAAVESGQRGGASTEPVARQPGSERSGGTRVEQRDESGREVGGPSGESATEPSVSSEAARPEERSGKRPASNARPNPAEQSAGLTPEDENHRIAPDDVLVPGGDKTKARANIAALKLLKQIEAEKRNPTPEEKKVLAQYVGWGGLPQVFDEYKARYDEGWRKEWGKLHDELKGVLTKDEWAAAARSTINAHYTSRDIITRMWDLARRLGFKGGTVLETSAGIGHFLGLEPADLAAATKWRAVELDEVTGRMLKKLYPQAQVQVTGFQDARIPNHSADLVIGNYPFAKDGPMDDRYPRFSLHNYFFARAMDTLKPGGIMVAITSTSTMDGASSKAAREWLADRADLVGAIRLPNNAFKKNAGTEVTTDIVILRKRGAGAFTGGQNWLNTQAIPTYNGNGEVQVNEYFARNPEMMLGRMSTEGSMYGDNEPALIPKPNQDLGADLQAAIAQMPADISGAASQVPAAAVENNAEGEQAEGKEGAVVVKEGKAYRIEDGVLKATGWTDAKTAQAKSFVTLRDHLKGMIAAMANEGSSDEAIAAARAKLNEIYDKHVKKYGPLNGRSHVFLEDDPELPLVQALEDVHTVTRDVEVKSGKHAGEKRQVFEKEYRKATIFSKRTIFPRSEPTSADTLRDAIAQSLAYRNTVDVPYVANLRGITEEQATTQLEAEPDIYRDPKTGILETKDAYLSGFVREKLKEAKKAAESDPAYQKNVDALEKAQPEWLPIENIAYRLGSTWLPPKVIQSFLREKLEVGANVLFVPQTGHWKVEPTSGWQSAVNTTTHGTQRIAGHDLVELALNLKSPVIYDEIETPDGKKREKNTNDTLIAQQKQQELKDLFRAFVAEKAEFHPELEKIYNEQFNGVRLRDYIGPAWEHYPNAATEVTLRQHQKNVTSRILQNSTLLAHSVGTGKTYIMITAAMEMRRLGMAKKPMIATQNATTQQFAASFKKLYPTARILVPTRKQREAANRNKLMSQIATGDYDSVIIPQSFLNQLPDDPERLKGFIDQEIKELEEARYDAARSGGKNSPRVKDLEKAKARLEERLKKLADRKTDDTVSFEQLGVDALFVDEAHAYKKLEFTTQMENINGLDRGASERGLGLYMKTRWIQEKNNGKNVVLATGTPVSNTIAEAWNMLRFTRPDLLQKYGVTKFDEFASTFGDTVTNIEQTAGGAFKQVTRFAKYTNGPELISLFHSAADVVLKEDVNLPGLPAVKGGQPTTVQIKQTPRLKEYIGVLRERLERFERMTGREKRENSHIPLVTFGDAKKATLDLRLIDAAMPDEPGNKMHTAAAQIARIYRESNATKGTQLVFADLFQSHDGKFNLYHAIRDELLKAGIPASEIAIINEAKTDAQRERIFDGVKSGAIRVMFGSTEKMGVGVNVQDKLIALHHLDAPHRPMDIEQRNGRIVRQGNENPIVEILNYGVENTLDATLYQRLAIKQKFINQIMRGDITGRSFEDAADEVSMTFEEQMAAFSGNPLAMKKVALEGEVRRLEALKQGHIRQLAQTRGKLTDTKRDLANREAYLPRVESAAKRVADLFGEKMEGEVDGTKYTERKPLVEALEKRLSTFASEQSDAIGDQLNARGWEFPAGVVTIHGLPVQLTLRIPTDWKTGKMTGEAHFSWATLVDGVKMEGNATTGSGLLMSLAREAKTLQSKPEQVRGDIARLNRDTTEMTGFLTQPFQQEEQLKKAIEEREAIDRELTSETSAKSTEQRKAGRPAELPLGDEKVRAPRMARLRRMAEQMRNQAAKLRAEAEEYVTNSDEEKTANYRAAAIEDRLKKVDTELKKEEAAGLERAKANREPLGTPAVENAEPEIQYTIFRAQEHPFAPGVTIPGYVQIEQRANNGRGEPLTDEQRARYPQPPAWLPSGQYTLDQIEAARRNGPGAQTVLGTPRVRASDAQEAILAKVNGTLEDKRSLREKIRDYIADLSDYVATELKQKLIDQFAAIKRLERQTYGRTANLDASASAYKATRLTKNLPSVMDYLMRFGQLEYRDGSFAMKSEGKGLMQIFKPLIDAGTLRLWEGYATALRASRLLQEGKETNFGRTINPQTGETTWNAADARREIDELLKLGQEHPEFEQVRQEYVAFQKSILDVAESAGLINAAQRALWEKSDYVPFYRITESLDGKGPRQRRGIADQRSGIRRLKGGAAPVAIMENIVRNVETMIDASFKNVAMQRVADLAEGNNDMLVRIPYKAVPFTASVEEVLDQLEKAGVDTSGLSTEEAAEFVKFWRMRAPKGKDVVSVMVDGKPIYYRVKDAALLRSVQSMGPRAHAWWMNALMAPKHLLTHAVTLDPAFMVANTIRDSFSAWVIADTPIRPGIDAVSGFMKSLRNDPAKLAIMAAGGGSGHYNNLRGGEVRDYIRQLTPAARKSFLESIIDTPKKAARLYAEIGRATENANRIAIAESVRKRGGSEAESAFQALDIMDFGLRGDSALLNFFLDTVPFLNARIQGLYRLARGLKEDPKRVATHGAIIAGATVALLAANWDDDRYWELPEWERDVYYHFWIGGQHIRIPKPFEVGQVFGTGPERFLEYLGKTGDGKLLGRRLLTMIGDTFAMNPIPQAMRPLAERAMNLNTFTGRPIISRGDEYKQPEQQFNAITSETVREIADAMPDSAPAWMRSPKTLEHFIRGYFGSIGMYVLTGADALTRAAGDYPERPEVKPTDWWVMKRFAPSSDVRETKYVGQFYDLQKEIQSLATRIRELQKRGDLEQAREVQNENRELLRFSPRAESSYKAIEGLRKQQDRVYRSSASPAQKRQQLAAIATRRNQIAEQTMLASPRRPAPIFNPFSN